MNTIILMWNPAFSSYTMERFENDLAELKEDEWSEGVGNWSVWEHEKANYQDRFFLVRVGEGNTGIVMAGTFTSDPYEDEDWSGKGRQTFYMDLSIEAQIHSDKVPFINTEILMKELPGFDWTGGHSGRLLDKDLAERLEVLWLNYLYQNRDLQQSADAFFSYDVFEINEIMEKHLDKSNVRTCAICGYNYQHIFGQDCENTVPYSLIIPPDNTKNQNDKAEDHIYCICKNCKSAGLDHIHKKLN